MTDFTKPPTKDQIEAWPPLTLDDIFEIEESQMEQAMPVFTGDMGRARTMALVHAHKIAAMWPRIVTTAMMLWDFQKHASPPSASAQGWQPKTRVIYFSSDDINAPYFNSKPNDLSKLKCHVVRDDDYQRLLKAAGMENRDD